MSGLVTIALVAGVLIWFIGKPRRQPAPEDDVNTPTDRAALAEAERELEADGRPRSPGDAEAEDDWGPGTRR